MRQFFAKVKPGSKHGPLIEEDVSGDMTVYLRQKAIDGKANVELVELISKHHQINKSKIQIVSGQSTIIKKIRMND